MLTLFGATFSDCHTLFGATFARNMGKFFGCGFIYSGTFAFAENGARFCTSTSLSEQFRTTCSAFAEKLSVANNYFCTLYSASHFFIKNAVKYGKV